MIEATTKRLEKTALLTSFLLLVIQRSNGNPQSLLQAIYLCINRLSPDYIGIELGIGESLLIKAIGESTGRSLATIKAELKKEGDLGLVAMASRGSWSISAILMSLQNSKNRQKTLAKPKALTIPFVFSNLKEIALTAGNSVTLFYSQHNQWCLMPAFQSQSKKVAIITKLLAACQDFEAKYIVRSLEGKLRIGNAERSVLVSLAHAAVLAEKERIGQKWSNEKLAARLEEGSNVMKGVYRYTRHLCQHFGIDTFLASCPRMTKSSLHYWNTVWTACASTVSSHPVFHSNLCLRSRQRPLVKCLIVSKTNGLPVNINMTANVLKYVLFLY